MGGGLSKSSVVTPSTVARRDSCSKLGSVRPVSQDQTTWRLVLMSLPTSANESRHSRRIERKLVANEVIGTMTNVSKCQWLVNSLLTRNHANDDNT